MVQAKETQNKKKKKKNKKQKKPEDKDEERIPQGAERFTSRGGKTNAKTVQREGRVHGGGVNGIPKSNKKDQVSQKRRFNDARGKSTTRGGPETTTCAGSKDLGG